jgi:hypothetical protein
MSYRRQIRYKQMRDARIYGGNYGANVDKNGKSWFQNKRAEDPNYGNDMNRKQLDDAYWDDKRGESQQRDLPNVNNLPMPGVSVNSMPNGYSIGDNGILLKSKSVDVAQTGTLKGVSIGRDPLQNVQVHIAPIEQKAFNFANPDQVKAGQAGWADVQVADRKALLSDPNFYKNNKILEYDAATQQEMFKDPSFDWKQLPWAQKKYFELSSSPTAMGAAQGLVMGAGNPGGAITGGAIGTAAAWAGYDQNKEFWQQGDGKFTFNVQQIKDISNGAMGFMNYAAEFAEKTIGTAAMAANAMTDPNRDVADVLNKDTWNSNISFFEAITPAYIAAGGSQALGKDGRLGAVDALKLIPTLFASGAMYELVANPEKYKGKEYYLGAALPVELEQSWVERLDDARARVAAGENEREVMSEMQNGLMAQMGDMIGQGIFDPLNLVGGLGTFVGKVSSNATGNKVAGAAFTGTKNLTEAKAKYKNLVQTEGYKVIDPNFDPKKMSSLSKMIAGVTTDIHGNITNKAGSLFGMSKAGLLDPIRPDEYVSGPVKSLKDLGGFVKMLATETPQARAETGGSLFADNVTAFLGSFENSRAGVREGIKYLKALASNDMETWSQMGSQFANSPEFYTVLPALQKFNADKLSGLLVLLEGSEVNSDYLQTISDITGDAKGRLIDDIALRGTAEQDFARVIEKAKTSTDPKAKSFLAEVEAKKFTAQTLAEIVDVFTGEGALPRTPEHWKALIGAELSDHYGEWAAKNFQLDKSPEAKSAFFQTMGILKSAQSFLLLGGSPSYPIQNGLSGLLHLAASGIYGFTDETFLKDFGDLPSRMEEGVGSGGVVESKGGAIQKAMKGERGVFTSVKDRMGKISSGMPMSKFSSWIEKKMGRRAIATQMKRMWSQSWRRGVGFSKMKPELINIMKELKVDPERFYGAIEAGLNQAQIEKALYGKFEGVQSRALIHEAATVTGKSVTQSRTMLETLGVFDQLDSYLRGRTTRDGVNAAFDKALKVADDQVDIRMGENLIAKADLIKQKVGLEGGLAALDVAQQASMKYTNAWHDHYILFGDLNERLKDIPDPKMQAKEYKRAYQQSDKDFVKVNVDNAVIFTGVFNAWGQSKNTDALNFLKYMGDGSAAMKGAYDFMRQLRDEHFSTEWNGDIDAMFANWDRIQPLIDKAMKEGFAKKRIADVKMGESIGKMYKDLYGPEAGEAARRWSEDVVKFNDHIREEQNKFNQSLSGKDKAQRAAMKAEYYPQSKQVQIAELARINQEGIGGLERVIKAGQGGAGSSPMTPNTPVPPTTPTTSAPSAGAQAIDATLAERAQADAQMKADEAAAVRPEDEINSAFNDGQGKPNAPAKPTPAQEFADMTAKAEQRVVNEQAEKAAQAESIWSVAAEYTDKNGKAYTPDNKWALIGALKKEEYGGDSTLLGFDDITPEFIRDVLEKQKTVHEARAAEAAQVVQADVITKPRSELDPRLSEALNMEAKRIADVVSGGEAGKRQFADGKFIGATSSTYPDWYNDLQKQTGGKQKLLAALEKIQKDHGADKGVVVERVKEFLTWSLMNGDTATGSPPRLDVLKLLGADDATLNNALLDLNEQFGTAFTLEQALDNNFESYDPMAGIASNEPAFDAQAWEDGVMKAAQGDDLLAVYEAIDLPAEMYDRAMFEGGETYRQFIEKITKDAENANEIRNRDEAVATHMTEAEQAITQQASKSNAVMTRKLLEEKFTESFGDEPQVQAFMSVFDAVVGTFARITGENVDSFTARFYEDVMRSNETDFEDGLNQAYGRIEIAERTLTQVDFENLARMLVRQGEGELRRAIQSEPNKANRRAILEEVYKLNSKLGDKVARSEIALFQRAYHGSPYKFDKFSLDHMGKGEGNQAYGWGLYFAGDKAVAEWYRETLSYRKTGDAVYKGERIDERQKRTAVMDIERNAKTKADAESSIAAKLEVIDDRIASGKRIQQNPTVETRGDKYYAHPVVGFGKHFDTLKEGKDWARLEWAKEIADLYKERQQIASISLDDFDFQEVNKGQLYNVEIPDDGYLLWDKPLSEQPQAIKDAIRKGGYEIYKKDNYEAVRYDGAYYDTGESIYNLLKQGYGTKRGASTALKEAGLNGIKYLDGDSRGAGEGNFNYVIFDDAAIDVVETYYQAQEASTKGAVTFDGLQATIHAFEAADVTTLVHENAHVFMQMLKDVAAKTKNETVVRDLATIMEHVRADEVSAGVWKNANADHSITAKDGKFVYQGPTATDTLVFDSFEQAEGVLQQEVFARSWENYQATGKAPTPALVKAFESFRTWMLDIYKSITGSEIDVKISEDVRQVFDRMLGAEDVKPRLGEGEYNYEGNVDQFGGRGMFNANSDRNVREFFIRKGMPRQYVEGTSYRVLSGLIEQMIPLTSQRGTFDWNDLGSAQADWIRKLEMPSSKNKDALYHKNLKKVQGGQADMFAQPAPQAELFAQVEPSAVAKVEPVWKYEEYSAFSRKLAQTHPKAELEKKLRQLEGEQSRNTNAHLAAIDKTSSMTGNSQHRAQSGNVVRGNYEQRRFLEDALEIYKQYPDKTKESVAPAPQVIEFIQGKLASAEKMNKKYPGSMGKDWLDKLQGAADTYKTYVEKHGEDYPIVLMRDETQGAIITQSNHVIGEWQVTYFDKQGFSGHHNEKTKAEAYWDTYNQGMTRPDPDLFESMSATDLFNAGVVWSQMPDDKRFQTSIEQVRQEMFGQAPQPAAAPQVDMFGQATQDTGTMGGMLPGMQSATGMMFDVQAGITKMDAGRARSLFDVDATRSTADKAGTALSAGDIVTDENGKRYNVKGANLRGKVLTMDGKILEPASVERVARQETFFQRAEPVDTPEFKNWFGESKVVDGDGRPKIMRHGSNFIDFQIFDINKIGKENLYGPGFYFTDNTTIASDYSSKGMAWKWVADKSRAEIILKDRIKEAAKNDTNINAGGWDYYAENHWKYPPSIWEDAGVYIGDLYEAMPGMQQGVFSVYLSIKNPFDMDAKLSKSEARGIIQKWIEAYPQWDKSFEAAYNSLPAELTNDTLYNAVIKKRTGGAEETIKGVVQNLLIDMGYDGITHTGGGRVDPQGIKHKVFIAFNSEQIKSTANRGTFDPNNPNILYQNAKPTPKPEPINMGGEQSFGSVDNALGDLSIPHDEIMAEGMKTEVRPLLEAMREIALKQVSDPAARMDGMRDMSPEGQKMLRQYMKQVQNEMASAKLSTMRWGETKRDEALLNYSKRYGIDRYLEIAYPYQFFYTRSMMSWAARAIDKPAWFANYARIKRQQDRYERDIPERLRGKIKIDMPWMPDWMGDSMYINPMGLFTPANFLKPFERMQSDSTMQQQEAERILQEWSADESVSATAAQTAAQTRTGTTWERALAEAKIRRESEIGNPLDFFNTMLGPAWYLTTPLNAMGIKTSISDGDPNKITSTPLMNTSRALDTVTQGTWAEGFGNVAGIYAKVEQGIQKKLGVPEFGEYGDYYIDRQLANMTAEGAISAEDAQMAMMERSGKNFEDARERVKLELAMRVPTMAALMAGLTADNFAQGVGRAASTMPASLFGAALLPAGELEYRGLKQEWNEALKKSDAGDKTAIPEFFDENPEYQAYLSKGKPPEERIKSFLIGQIWDGYMELGETNQKQARAQMGDLFSQSFLDKETRSYDTLTVEQLTDWAKMFGKKTPLPLSTEAAPQVDTLGGNEPAALNLYDPQVTQYTDAYFSQLREKFPNYYQTEQGYYNIPKSERTAYLMAHPDLKQYWNWKDSWSQAHPELVPIFKGQVFKQVDTSNWSPALVDYVQMYAMTGERLGKGATAALNQQWIMAGSPYGDMQSWLDSQVAPAMLYSGGGQ